MYCQCGCSIAGIIVKLTFDSTIWSNKIIYQVVIVIHGQRIRGSHLGWKIQLVPSADLIGRSLNYKEDKLKMLVDWLRCVHRIQHFLLHAQEAACSLVCYYSILNVQWTRTRRRLTTAQRCCRGLTLTAGKYPRLMICNPLRLQHKNYYFDNIEVLQAMVPVPLPISRALWTTRRVCHPNSCCWWRESKKRVLEIPPPLLGLNTIQNLSRGFFKKMVEGRDMLLMMLLLFLAHVPIHA